MHESYEHPPIVVERNGYNHAIEFFLNGEVLGGYFAPHEEEIGIFALCPDMEKELPYIWDVVFTLDHEFMHWLLYAFVDDWVSECFDDICRSIEAWMLEPDEEMLSILSKHVCKIAMLIIGAGDEFMEYTRLETIIDDCVPIARWILQDDDFWMDGWNEIE